MKASDTVMPFSQIEAIDLKNAESNFTDALYDVAREQAEISFKAGIDEGRILMANDLSYPHWQEIEAAKQIGIKEVVERVNEAKITTDVFQEDGSIILRKGDIVLPQIYWESKLKEWIDD